MLRNYLIIAIRNILRNKTYSCINIFGLAVAMSIVILITLYLHHEWSYDTFHKNKDSIYRVVQITKRVSGVRSYSTQGPLLLGPTLVQDYPEITNSLRFGGPISTKVHRGEDRFYQRVQFTDPSLFEMFDFPLIEGDSRTAISDPNSVVITDKIAKKFFGDASPLGQSLTMTLEGTDKELLVTGVTHSPPSNSTIQFELIVHMDNRSSEPDWGSGIVQTYVQVSDQADIDGLESQFITFARTYYEDIIDMRQNREGMPESFYLSKDEDAMTFELQPLREVYLHMPWIGGATTRGKPVHSFILSGISILILLLAGINFVTLTIGQSAGRAKEVGIRKVLGAHRGRLMQQFWGEAFIVSASASLFGLILAELLLPTFNSLTSQNLTLQPYLSLIGLAGLLVFVMLISFLAGSYPSFYLSQFQAVECLQSNRLPLGKGKATRLLVTLQYAVSIFLICCTVLMLRQLHFLVNADIGFKRENIVVVPIRGSVFMSRNAEEANRQQDLLKTELYRDPRIEYVIATSSPATRGGAFIGIRDSDGEPRMFASRMVDPGYLEVFGLELVKGRFFDDSMGPVNTSSVVVSESFVRLYDLETPVVGQSIPNLLGTDTNPSIIGVVRDFHVRSLHREVDPVLLHMNPERNFGASQLLIKIRPDDRAGAIGTIESVWQIFNPDTPFEYSFLDEDMENVYAREARWGAIVTDSSVFAILIACLGLFGLASLAVTRRTKEIGIRKVVGASVAQIVGMLSKEFLILVLIANVIAWPIAWYAMSRWLENFAYRIDLGVGTFLLAGLLALVIALATVSVQAIKAATANPVEALRYE